MRIRRLIRDGTAIASVVGTIMSLMVFLAFLSMFTTQYVPVWMADNEATHTDTVLSELGTMRQNMDILILSNNRETSMYSTLTLGAKGVPVFAAPTLGIFTFAPLESAFTTDKDMASASVVKIDYFDVGLNAPNTVSGAGRVELYSPNRYYVQQWSSFDDGGIILAQTDGEWMRTGPSIRLEKRDTNPGSALNISFKVLTLVGKKTTITGAQTIGVKTQLMNDITPDQQMYGNATRTINMTVYTLHKPCWREWFNRTLADSGLISGTDYTLDYSASYKIKVAFKNVVYLSVVEAILKMDVGEEV
jgi:hypothetical protein